MKICKVEPGYSTCKRCIDEQAEYGIIIPCSKCIERNKTYEVLKLVPSHMGGWALLQDDNGKLINVNVESIFDLEEC